MRNVSHRLGPSWWCCCGRGVMELLGSEALLEEVHHWGWLGAIIALPHSRSLSAISVWLRCLCFPLLLLAAMPPHSDGFLSPWHCKTK